MEERVIAGYQVVRRLGAGGMGEVFLVQHPRLPRRDALKLLDATVSRKDDFAARFQREADLLAPLSHQNITTLYDRGAFGGRLWITMEYVDGTDAARLLLNGGPMPVPLALDIAAGTAAGLDYAFARHGITHRDVKPANILVGFHHGALSEVKIADFGIAKARDAATPITSTGMTIGTVHYMSPEAIDGNSPDNRADQYSLACTAFEFLTGSPPYTAETMSAQMSAHFSRPVPRITERRSDLPSGFDPVFAKALAKRPDERYATSGEFVTALQSAARRAGTPATGAAMHSAGSLPTGGQSTGMQPRAMPSTGLHSTGLHSTGAQATGLQGTGPQDSAPRPGQGANYPEPPGTAEWGPQEIPGTRAWPAAETVAPASEVAQRSTARRPGRRLLLTGAAIVLVLVLALTGVMWTTGSFGEGTGTAADVESVVPASVRLVDFSASPDSSRNLDNVITGAEPAWHTATYFSGPDFGNLKAGLGLMFTFDRNVTLVGGSITSPSTGATVEVRTSDSESISSVGQTIQVWSGSLSGGETSFQAAGAEPGRYVLVWISGLAGSGSDWSTTISHVTFTAR